MSDIEAKILCLLDESKVGKVIADKNVQIADKFASDFVKRNKQEILDHWKDNIGSDHVWDMFSDDSKIKIRDIEYGGIDATYNRRRPVITFNVDISMWDPVTIDNIDGELPLNELYESLIKPSPDSCHMQ